MLKIYANDQFHSMISFKLIYSAVSGSYKLLKNQR